MWNLMKSVGVAMRLINDDSKNSYQDEEDKILQVLDASDSEDDVTNDKHNEIVSDICSHRVGLVTHFSDDGNSGMIDSVYYFDMINAPSNIKVGDRVTYIAYRRYKNSTWTVKNICAVTDDMWNNSDDNGSSDDEVIGGEEVQRTGVTEQSTVGKVVKRNGRELFIQPGNCSCNLDKISTSFVPVEGDWVLLKTLVEVNSANHCDRLLQIDSVSPLRSLVDKGKVSHWEPGINQGIIDSKVLFTLDTCDLGFVPIAGDQVLYDAIESEQGMLVWRALKVTPLLDEYKYRSIDVKKSKKYKENEKSDDNFEKEFDTKGRYLADLDENNDSDLLKNKNGIIITTDCNFYDIDVDSEKEIVIVVKNEGRNKQQLLGASFKSARTLAQSQIQLISPNIKSNSSYQSKPFIIYERSSVRFVFKVTPRFVGKTSELFVWKFKGFEVGRRINISIITNLISELQGSKAKKFIKKEIGVDTEKILATRNGFVVSSEKKFRAAAFVPVKMGHFPIPTRLMEAVLGSRNEERNRDTMIRTILEVAPSLSEPLNKVNYKQRFHSVLYLEEISALVSIRRYDMPRAHFRRHLDYLLLEVPGLAEKRPSLICGDTVIVSNPCTVDDDKNLKYEGSIYKICKNEIWLKFNKAFHDAYNGADYMVVFTINRIGFRRGHQAINVTYDHLSLDWLFPSCLRESKPQIIVDDENDNNDEIVDNSNKDVNNSVVNISETENILNKVLNDSNSNNESRLSNVEMKDVTCINGSNNLKEVSLANDPSSNPDSSFCKTEDNPVQCLIDSSVARSDLSVPCLSNTNKSTKTTLTPRLSVAERLKIALEIQSNNRTSSLTLKEESGMVGQQDDVIDNSKSSNTNEEKIDISQSLISKNTSELLSDDIPTALTEKSGDVSLSTCVKSDNYSVPSTNKANVHNSTFNTSNESINLNNFFNSSIDNSYDKFKLNVNSNDNVKLQMKTLEEIENSLLNNSCDSIKTSDTSNLDNTPGIDNSLFKKSDEISTSKFNTIEEIEYSILNNNQVIKENENIDNLSVSDVQGEENSNIKSEFSKNIDNLNTFSGVDEMKSIDSHSVGNNNSSKSNVVIDKNDNDDCYSKVLAVNKDVKINWQTTGRNWTHQLSQNKKKIRDVPNTYRRKVKWVNSRLNYHQKEAVKNILKGEARPLPYIIFGPPGTGKTITLVETALQLLQLIPESRLLISTPSNSAANLIAERLLDSGLDLSGILVRLCSHNYLTDENINISDKLFPYCTTAEIKVIEDDLIGTVPNRREITGSTREILGRHRVTIGTCVTLGVLYNMGFPQGHFTHILVDEAGQATEPEILIPLAFLDEKYGQAILAGDPMQLGPVVQSRLAIEFGLQESLLSRFLQNFPYMRDIQSFPETFGFDPRIVTRLVDNYRSLPEILKLPSTMFYEGSLVPQVKEVGSAEATVLLNLRDQLPPREIDADNVTRKLPPALVFHGVRGVNYQEEDSPSWFNPQEIVQVIFYINMLYKIGLTPDQIGIVTPYQKQVLKIRSSLTKLEIPVPKVGSVEEFQGQERMVIILSAVRSNSKFIVQDAKHALGFVSSPQRLNVALTRARALLIVLGNPHLLNCDPYWRTVLKYCIQNQAYCGCDLPTELEEYLKDV